MTAKVVHAWSMSGWLVYICSEGEATHQTTKTALEEFQIIPISIVLEIVFHKASLLPRGLFGSGFSLSENVPNQVSKA
jgi:hypothetical protein